MEIFEKIKNFEISKFFENLIFLFSNEISKFFKKNEKIENFSSPKKYFVFHTVTLLLINRLLIFWVFFDVDLSRGGAESR